MKVWITEDVREDLQSNIDYLWNYANATNISGIVDVESQTITFSYIPECEIEYVEYVIDNKKDYDKLAAGLRDYIG